jgi:MFS family permease
MPSQSMTFPPPSGSKIPREAWKIVAILSSVATMIMYAETMLIPAIPTLIKEFGITYSTSSWILTTYLLTGAVMTPIAGKMSDIYGKKRILLVIMTVYAAGVSIAGFSTNISTMLIARGLQGVGISMFPIAFSIVRDRFPREKMAIGQGIITSMFAGGAVIGLSVGGFLIQNYGWHSTFFTIIPIVICLFLVVWRFIHIDSIAVPLPSGERQQQQEQEESEHTLKEDGSSRKSIDKNTLNRDGLLKGIKKSNSLRTRQDDNKARGSVSLDIKGAITLAIAITSFLLALTYLQREGDGNNNTNNNTNKILDVNYSVLQVTIFFAVGIISLISFIVIERRSKSPLIDFNILLNRAILPAYIMILIVGLSLFLVFQTIPILVRNPPPVGFGGDAISTTRVQLPFALILLVFGPASGFIISKVGTAKSLIIGTVISAVGFFGLFSFHSSEFMLSVNLGILSVGLSFTAIGAQNTIVLNTPRQSSGISLGIASLLRIVGSSIGPALAAVYLQSYQYKVANIIGGGTARQLQQHQVAFPNAEAYNLIFLTAAILSLASISLALFLKLSSASPKCQNQVLEERGKTNTQITQTIKEEILKWPGITTEPNRFGGIEFLVNKKEMGHLHGEKLADLPFPVEIRKELVASGRALPHHIYPESGWVSYWIRNSDDIPAVLKLFEIQYERLSKSAMSYPS